MCSTRNEPITRNEPVLSSTTCWVSGIVILNPAGSLRLTMLISVRNLPSHLHLGIDCGYFQRKMHGHVAIISRVVQWRNCVCLCGNGGGIVCIFVATLPDLHVMAVIRASASKALIQISANAPVTEFDAANRGHGDFHEVAVYLQRHGVSLVAGLQNKLGTSSGAFHFRPIDHNIAKTPDDRCITEH